MLVGQQDGIQPVDVLSDSGKTFFDFPPAQPGVDQDTSLFRSNEDAVARAAAREDADPYDVVTP